MEPKYDDMTPFEQWFYGCGAYGDGDLSKDENGEYEMPMTRVFHECWETARTAEEEE